jgi:hypothetical protein
MQVIVVLWCGSDDETGILTGSLQIPRAHACPFSEAA